MLMRMRLVTMAGLVALAAAGTPAAASGRGSGTTIADARNRFVAVETFARMSAAEQARLLPTLYRNVVPYTISPDFSEYLASSIVINLLDPTARAVAGQRIGGPEQYADQLQAAVPRMTVEQVADKLGSVRLLKLATRARTHQALRAQEKPLAALIEADLDSKDLATFSRGSTVVAELRLTAFTNKILDVYFINDARGKEASRVLVNLRDPAMVPRLRQDVERDSRTLVRHSDALRTTLYGQKADPVIVKLLSSEDAELRYHAARALSDCDDAALAKPIADLAKDKTVRTQEFAMLMAARLPQDAFASIREDLVPLLRSAEATVQHAAIRAFAGQKDLAVAIVLREFLTKPLARPGAYDPAITQSLYALTGSMFGYDAMNWGPEKNAAAIERFDQWVLQHGGTVVIPNQP